MQDRGYRKLYIKEWNDTLLKAIGHAVTDVQHYRLMQGLKKLQRRGQDQYPYFFQEPPLIPEKRQDIQDWVNILIEVTDPDGKMGKNEVRFA